MLNKYKYNYKIFTDEDFQGTLLNPLGHVADTIAELWASGYQVIVDHQDYFSSPIETGDIDMLREIKTSLNRLTVNKIYFHLAERLKSIKDFGSSDERNIFEQYDKLVLDKGLKFSEWSKSSTVPRYAVVDYKTKPSVVTSNINVGKYLTKGMQNTISYMRAYKTFADKMNGTLNRESQHILIRNPALKKRYESALEFETAHVSGQER